MASAHTLSFPGKEEFSVTRHSHRTLVLHRVPGVGHANTKHEVHGIREIMLQDLTHYTDVLGIVGDILRIRARDVGFGDLAVVENWDGETSLAGELRAFQETLATTTTADVELGAILPPHAGGMQNADVEMALGIGQGRETVLTVSMSC